MRASGAGGLVMLSGAQRSRSISRVPRSQWRDSCATGCKWAETACSLSRWRERAGVRVGGARGVHPSLVQSIPRPTSFQRRLESRATARSRGRAKGGGHLPPLLRERVRVKALRGGWGGRTWFRDTPRGRPIFSLSRWRERAGVRVGGARSVRPSLVQSIPRPTSFQRRLESRATARSRGRAKGGGHLPPLLRERVRVKALRGGWGGGTWFRDTPRGRPIFSLSRWRERAGVRVGGARSVRPSLAQSIPRPASFQRRLESRATARSRGRAKGGAHLPLLMRERVRVRALRGGWLTGVCNGRK